MHSSTLLLLSLVSSAFGFLVTRPSLTQGWTNQGAQTVEWQRVSTDPTNFTVILTNLDRKILASDIVLASGVDAVAASSMSVSPPSSGWPTPGGSYRVNLVKSSSESTTIYAQSSEFNITASTVTQASATGTTLVITSATRDSGSSGSATRTTAATATGSAAGNGTDGGLQAPTSAAFLTVGSNLHVSGALAVLAFLGSSLF